MEPKHLTIHQQQASHVIKAIVESLKEVKITLSPGCIPIPPISDVIIASFMKSGSSFIQHVMYQMLSASNRAPTDPKGTDYEDITEIAPILEFRTVMNLIKPRHATNPQIWKTHLAVHEFKARRDSRRKYIVCIRNPLHVARSLLDFMGDWQIGETMGFFQDPNVRIELYPKFVMEFFLQYEQAANGTYPDIPNHLAPWYQFCRGWMDFDDGNILYAIYEDSVKDSEATTRTIARFINVDINDDAVQRVVLTCDREKMAKDPRSRARILSRKMNWDESKGHRVRGKDRPGFKGAHLPQYAVDACWEMFERAFGVRTYEELVDQLRKKNEIALSGC